VEFLTLDVHGGTSEDDILAVFKKAEDVIAGLPSARAFVFLDEVNTCGEFAHSKIDFDIPKIVVCLFQY
jgi:hypothetical protein